ncbi:glycosyltransferase family 2 protein [Rhodococcus sp. SBT000017]|uniref:glycosyltransferase family 2 protein n=1 Tax=Rhodococcus sp. SBT000017 TaxID=1803385 RepID=UPI000EF88820|nr:glycosyltransferase family 2 protein [Rhodococcus sp. SBT000017]RMB77385.1 glycosyltransferase family 2 protein [Rhodococcus sp. SBT000017]
MPSAVVIPAHNEGSVIERCIRTLLASADTDEFHVCVVSNGSSDNTVAQAKSVLQDWPLSTVVDIDVPSKIEALRAGDRAMSHYPRVYLDADIQMTTETLRALVNDLEATDSPAVAAPKLVVDWRHSTWPVRAYHKVWVRLPYVEEGVIGSGVYAVNRAGGDRIGMFPDVVNDDAYVRGLFSESERLSTEGEFVSVAPVSLRALIRRRARTELGNKQVDTIITGSGTSSTRESLLRVARSKDIRLAEVVTYVGITLAAKVLAAYRKQRGTDGQWSMDMSSRNLS